MQSFASYLQIIKNQNIKEKRGIQEIQKTHEI